MTLLYNLMLPLILLSGLFLTWKFKKIWILAITLLVLFIYFKAQPSYLPKGQINRTALPAFEAKPDLEIEDRLSKPKDPDQRQAEQDERYRNGLEFIQK